ncbi:NAD-binding protein [Roseobacter sp. HKCCD9010]|uniref:NAD(P)-dependent oxidoreductase n=1 Tax=unclassified Roseobacter TaxID=196798 RepID=UPI0014920AF2|nr:MULTISPECIES: NAD(P)-dependent oxidoreductase [unclassified Roseobacter]MBF9051237.1 NAD-binding protein [Rhodobacterales bacterium HKCCD4356]NNV13284.1 NAD-binding protein [Roseobacter sp. HKCCD7357]NNV17535.1 NAD-binding protein [Roseobacter sp. HKCCD8768]NNV27141.1 NAD-binding protein [Roseobacter sp. HKCCD8192]NNV31261.1 NAD-binding protein [Roseobacter sp. HKCCD9061]
MERIGVVGLGRMGGAMAQRFQAEGVPVTGWTRSGRGVAGIASAPDLAALVAESDVLVLSLYDDAAVTDMLDALLALDLTGKLIVETSTVAPSCLTDRIEAFAAKGAGAVDAPIAGGPELVLAGQCGIFVGGEDVAAKRALTVLAALTERVFHVGPLGTGMVMKVINNSMLQTYVTGLVEMMRLAKRAGLPLETAIKIVSHGPAGVPMVAARIPKILGEDKEVGFTVAGILKDNEVFQRVARDFGVEAPSLAAAELMQNEGIALGLADQDPAALIAEAYARA